MSDDAYAFITDMFKFIIQDEMIWIVILGTILAYVLGFAMGANDVSNAFGTSVGSGALTLTQAFALASVFEALGALLLGYNVIDTMRKGIVDVNTYKNDTTTLLYGQIATLGGCSMWLITATFLNMPVSTTHSIVGAVLGYTLAYRGTSSVNWIVLLKIVGSWFVSPLAAGATAVALYTFIDHIILRKEDVVENGLQWLPIFASACISINVFVVIFEGSKLINIPHISLPSSLAFSFAVAILVATGCRFFVVPWMRRRLKSNEPTEKPEYRWRPQTPPLRFQIVAVQNQPKFDEEKKRGNSTRVGGGGESQDREISRELESGSSTATSMSTAHSESNELEIRKRTFCSWLLPGPSRIDDRTRRLFTSVQILTACFAGFAHGANDVSNAVAPLVTIMNVFRESDQLQKRDTAIDVLLLGICAIIAGLWILGDRVIYTVGNNITAITPVSGFAMEFGAATTVIIASKLGLPISTTHCLVGAIVAVGMVQNHKDVDLKLFTNIIFAWLVTVPVAAAFSAAIALLLRHFVPPSQATPFSFPS